MNFEYLLSKRALLRVTTSPLFVSALLLLLFGSLALFPDRPAENRLLLLSLNALLISSISIFVAFLALRAYMTTSRGEMLLTACALLSFGISALISGYVVARVRGPNGALTVFNSGALLSGFLHLAAALRMWREDVHQTRAVRPRAFMGVGLVLAFIGLSWLGANLKLLPAFYIAGQGSTTARILVLTLGIAFMTAASVLVLAASWKRASLFLRTYSIGLGFIGLGMLVVLLAVPGSSLGWLGRIAQYLGNIYFLAAIVTELHSIRGRGFDAAEVFSDFMGFNEDPFRRLLQASINGLFIYDLGQGVHTYINPSFTALTGYTLQDLRGMEQAAVLALFHPEDWPAVQDHLSQVRQAADGQIVELEYRFKTRGGHWIWCLSWDAVFTRKPDGAVARIIGSFVDITERKHSELALKEHLQRYELVMAGSNAAIWDWDVVHHRMLFSPRWKALRELSDVRISDHEQEWINRIHPEDAPRVQAAVQAHFEGLTPAFREEYRILCADGSHKWVSNRGLVQRDADGCVVRMAGSEIDITDRKRAEAMLTDAKQDLEWQVSERTARLQETVAALQAEISQRIKAEEELGVRATQLRALAGELTMTEQRERKRLARVLHDGLQQHLAAAKLHLGGLAAHGADVDLSQRVMEVEELLSEAIQMSRSLSAELSPPILHEGGLPAALKWLVPWMRDKHNFKVELSIAAGYSEPAEDVKVLLFESIRELLFNAAKHAQVPSATVALRATAQTLIITVSDQGVGFDSGLRKNAGESGAGFGLFSIRERLVLVGGEFQIESSPGKGSRFTLSVPQRRVEVQPHITVQPMAAAERTAVAGSHERIRVLIADDHALFRDGLTRILKNQKDLEVAGEAVDGEQVIELSRRTLPDAILMDIRMPKINGIEATRIIHQEQPGIRIIGLSMEGDEESAHAMRQAGAIDYRHKGCAAAELIAAILAAVKSRRTDTGGTGSESEAETDHRSITPAA